MVDTSDDIFDELHAVYHKSQGKTCDAPREGLSYLLGDHKELADTLQRAGVRITLCTAVQDIMGITAAYQNLRSNAKKVTVPRQSLINLLMDHSTMVGIMEKYRINVDDRETTETAA